MSGDRRASRSGPGQGLPDAFRGEGHVEVSDAQVSQRVDYRVLHRGCGSDAAGLADPLGPQRVHRGGGLHDDPLVTGDLHSRHRGVVGQVGGLGVAVRVVAELLEESLGDTLG